MRRIIDYCVYLVVRLFICVIQAIRLETGHRIACFLAWLCCDVFKVRAKVVEENLRHAFPDSDEQERHRMAQGMWEHLFLMVVEIAHTPRKIHETNWRDHVRLHGARKLVSRLLENRPVIIVTGHFGNFEIAGFLLALLGFPSYTVARSLDNPFLHDFVGRFRGATGQHIIPKNGGYDQILEVLGRSGIMAFLADQAAGPKGCWVDFFGRPASAYKAIALLSLEHDAPVAVCYAVRTDGPLQFDMVVREVADPRDTAEDIGTIKDLTQWYTHQLEAGIREHPDQYWWVHRRWKDTRKKNRKKRQAARAA